MPDFDGSTYDPAHDRARLMTQVEAVLQFATVAMGGDWFTLPYAAKLLSIPERSVSARLRDLRKAKFGAWNVERRRVSGGLWQYRVTGEPGDGVPQRVRCPHCGEMIAEGRKR